MTFRIRQWKEKVMAKGGAISRREFLEKAGKLGGAALISSVAGGTAIARELEGALIMEGLWTGGTFRQDCVDAAGEAEGTVRARVDGVWRDFSTIPLPKRFVEWNLDARRQVLSALSDMAAGRGGTPPSLAGPHNAAMATVGRRREDSILEINNAFKGMGLCPARGIIREKISMMNGSLRAPMTEKLAFLQDMYADADNFDPTKLISLELYSTPDFETHTFLNLMAEPVTSLVFLDGESYEVRGIGQLVHPDDPEAGDYARSVVEYTNLAHSYFHGDFPRLFPGILIHVLEVFDNSPGTGRGVPVAN